MSKFKIEIISPEEAESLAYERKVTDCTNGTVKIHNVYNESGRDGGIIDGIIYDAQIVCKVLHKLHKSKDYEILGYVVLISKNKSRADEVSFVFTTSKITSMLNYSYSFFVNMSELFTFLYEQMIVDEPFDVTNPEFIFLVDDINRCLKANS